MKKPIFALAGVLALGACKESTDVPDLNFPSVASVSGTLTKGNLQTLTTGILNRERTALDYPFAVFSGTMARDVWRLDNSESRFITETLELPPSPGGFVGSRGFSTYFNAIRAENTLIGLAPKAGPEFQASDKLAITGFIRTLKANDFYRVLETRDTTGLPIAVDDPTQNAPILCKPAVMAYLSALLDSAYTDLQGAKAGGTTTFPVTLPSGWTGVSGDYSTIDNMIRYNRGLKGKIEVYRGIGGNPANDYQAAIAALNIALAGDPGTAASLQNGPYYQFSTSSGEVTNPLFDPRIHFTPSVFDSLQAGDKRGAKIVVRSTPATITIDKVAYSTLYDPAVAIASNTSNQTRPIGILRNEELYLLRAQAKIGAGDLAGATADMNVVRTVSGGLAPYPVFTSATAAINAVLYEKRYSLLLEGPQRLVDLRAYGRLNATSFPKGQLSPYANDPFNKVLPFPQAESDARQGNIACQ